MSSLYGTCSARATRFTFRPKLDFVLLFLLVRVPLYDLPNFIEGIQKRKIPKTRKILMKKKTSASTKNVQTNKT